jgi:hypothetical protein
MLLTRCGIDANDYYNFEDFNAVFDFNTPETVAVLGDATSDISEMALREISETIKNIQKSEKSKIRTFAEKEKNEYNNDTNKTERSFDYGTDLYNAGGLSSSRPDTTTGTENREIWNAAQNIPQKSQERDLRRDDDFKQINEPSIRDRQDSNSPDRSNNGTDGESSGRDRGAESIRSDEMGRTDEQHQALSGGNSAERVDLQLAYYDRETEDKSLPFFHSDRLIKEILKTSPHLKATKKEIAEFFAASGDDKSRKEYIKSIFNNDYTEITIDGNHRVGYKTYQNVLHLWEGSYNSRTSQSFYDWGVIADYFEGMMLLNELTDTMKLLPSVSQQMSLMDEVEEQKSSAFSFSQEIIDYCLQRGSGVEEGKYRIHEQFFKKQSANQNERFLSNEYGIGGASPIISGTNIGEWHDGKGITLSKDDEKLTFSWSKVAKHIGELSKANRYLSAKEKEYYPIYLQKQEELRQQIAEDKIARDILSRAPTDNYGYDFGGELTDLTSELALELYDHNFPIYMCYPDNTESLVTDRNEILAFDGYLGIENNEFPSIRGDNKAMPFVGRIDYLNSDGGIGEVIIYRDAEQFVKDIKEANYYGTPMSVTVYRNTATKEHISTDWINELDPPPAGFKYEDVLVPAKEPQETEPITPTWEKPKAKNRVQSFDLHPEIANADRINYHIINDELGFGGAKEKFANNLAAIKLLKQLESEGRFATPTEQESLSKYVGFGALSQAFDEKNGSWANEYMQLKTLLDESEYAATRESTLTAFYTSPVVIRAMYKAMENMSFKNGNILEPSCGTGNFLGMLPDSMQDCKMYGVELDSITGRIAQQLYQKSSIAVQGFEQTNLPDSFFDLAIGNVPFGQFKVADKRYDKHNFLIHDYFFGATRS